jgi:nucleoside-diphosphate kinase
MTTTITFTMIKPGSVADGHSGDILAMITQGGFDIKALKKVQLTKKQAEAFYAVHSERPFFNSLVSSMSAGPVVAAILEKENAVEAYRQYIGATNPADAAEGTIRKKFGKSIEANAVHGSDSNENAKIEADFFFSQLERP